MKYIKLYEELNINDLDKTISQICDRIKDTGYISKSMQKELEEVTGIYNIVDTLNSKVNEIIDFYDHEMPPDYVDDLLLEFFESSNYNYKINIGIHLPEKHSYFSFYDRNPSTNIFFGSEYISLNDKYLYLMSNMLLYIKNITKEINRISQEKEDKKSSTPLHIRKFVPDRRFMKPRNINHKYPNYFKHIDSICPIIKIDIKHKDSNEWWGNESIITGWNRDQFCYNWKPESLLSKIKRRINSIYPCEISNNPWSDHYTMYFNDERLALEDEILIVGSFDIKFK